MSLPDSRDELKALFEHAKDIADKGLQGICRDHWSQLFGDHPDDHVPALKDEGK